MNTLQADIALRIERLQRRMQAEGIEALVASSPATLLYLFGEVFAGLVYIPQSGQAQYLIRRPQHFAQREGLHYIRKIEDLASLTDLSSVRSVALELDELPYSEIERQAKLFARAERRNATALLRTLRMIKTPYEIEAIRLGCQRHMAVYRKVKEVYRSGMTDVELQIAIEGLMRRGGSVGLFRCFGPMMEYHMGSLLAGDNAAEGSPYDFAMGGAGSTALPLGANGTKLEKGISIMLDMAGNYGVYLSDITRTYSVGTLSDQAYRLHELSCRLHQDVMHPAQPGTPCSELYSRCLERVTEAGANAYFMGLKQQAQFVGHGLGLQINELPVLTARSRDILQAGMVIAFEPKFILPKIGAVGIENTYLVTEDGIENLSLLPEEIIDLEA